MILHLRLPNKFLLGLFSLTGATVVGAVWTFSGDAPIAFPKGRAFSVIGGTNGNHNRATITTGRGSARGKSGRGGSYVSQTRYVSQMLTLAAGGYTFDSSLEGRNFGFGANEVDVNGVQKASNLGSFNGVSVNFGNLVAGSQIAFAEDHSIPERAGQPHDDNAPVDNIYPTSVPPPTSSASPTSVPHPTSVPDFGGTFLLMLCSGAGLLIMGRLASRQLEK